MDSPYRVEYFVFWCYEIDLVADKRLRAEPGLGLVLCLRNINEAFAMFAAGAAGAGHVPWSGGWPRPGPPRELCDTEELIDLFESPCIHLFK